MLWHLITWPGVLAQGQDDCAVHGVFRHLSDGGLVYQIINEFARNNPQWQAYTGGASRQEIIRLLSNFLTTLTQNSDRKYKNPQARREIVLAVASLIDTGQSFQIGGQTIAAADFVLLFIFFVGSMPVRLQQRWAENLIQDSIEAYNAKLETYTRGQHISCPRGVIERMFLGLHAELMQGRERIIDERARRMHEEFDEQERMRREAEAAAALEAQKIASQKRGEGQGPGSRHKMVEEWAMQPLHG